MENLQKTEKDEDFYEKREGVDNVGIKYQHTLAVLFATRLTLDNNVANFKLSVDNKSWHDFDDIVLEIAYSDGTEETFAIQVKQTKNAEKFSEKNFCTLKKGYRLPDYYKGFEKSDLKNENLIISTTANFNDSANKDITRIFDFTKIRKFNVTDNNREEQEKWASVVLKLETNQVGLDDKRKFLFTCEENMNISRFIITEGGHDLNKSFFGKLRLILNQNKLEDIEKIINDEINTYFQIAGSEAATSLILFVEIAIKNMVVVDGNILSFKMTKRDFLIRISEVLLKSYIEKPVRQKTNFDLKTEFLFNDSDEIVTLGELLHIWDEFITCSDVTVIDNPDDSAKKNIWTIFSELVKQDSECEISDDTRCYREQIIQIRKKYYTSENLGIYSKNDLLQLLLVYWYNGKSALVLNDEKEPENLYKILPKIMDLFHFQKINQKMILLSNSNKNLGLSEKCKIVSTLGDIKNSHTSLYEEIINKVPLNIQDRFKCTISKLDEEIVELITSRNLLEIILQKYTIGAAINELNAKPLENYFDRKLEKVMLKKEVLNEEQDLFIVYCPESTPNLETIRKPNVAITHNINDNIFNNVLNQNRDKNVHFLGYNRNQCESYFEHIKTYGSMRNIRKHSIGIHISDKDLLKFTTSDQDPFRPFRENIGLITAPPGMGKTSLLHRWTKICPKNFWALMVPLNKSSDKFYSKNFKVEGFLEKIFTETYDVLSKVVLNIFLHRKKVVIFLDGFDEISPHYCEKVIKIIEFFNRERQCSQIVTTRECVTQKIQRPYNIFTYTLLPFDIEGQKMYLKYLGDNEPALCTHNQTERSIDTLKINFEKFDEKFIGMPLILNMIWKVFKSNKFKIDLDEISLIQQYVDVEIESSYRAKFFEGMVGNVEIVNNINFSMAMTELVAMNLFFGKESFMETYHNDINKFVSSIKEGGEKLGNIIDISENATPVFIHRLIAEYLAALWLKENGKKQPDLVPHLFETEKVIIRHLFDKLISKGKEIHGAILDDNLDKVKLLLESGGDIDQVDDFGRSALHLACSWGVRCNIPSPDKTFNSESYFETVQNEFINSGKIIQILHGSGPNKLVKFRDDILKYDCIDYAAKTCSLRTVEHLLKENCLNTVSLDNFPKESIAYYCTMYNFPCIMHATFDGTDFQEFFAKTRYCSNLDIQDIKNLLHVASEYGSVDIIDFCLKNTENIVDLCDNIQQTALHYAARGATNNHLKILKSLLDYNANINSQNYFGDTPLHSSASLGNAKSIELLLKYGANVNIKNNNRCTPIFNAIEKKQEHIFSFLLDKQLQINLTNHEGDTILHLASQGNLTSLVEQIIAIFKNVNVNSKNVKRKTALHYAAENGNLAIAKLLIAKKVDINWQDNQGNTALHLATQKNRSDIVKILCKHGADTEIPNSIGQTPLLIAVKEGLNLDNLSILKENNPRIVCEDSLRNTALHVAIKSSCDTIVDELIQKRVDEKEFTDLNSMNALRKRPIHLAIEKNNFALYKRFKEILGEKIEFDNNSESLLMVAIRNECNEIIEDLLLETNLDVNFKNVDGKTALNLAIKRKNYRLYKRLIELGADIHSRDNKRNTLLHKAVKHNLVEIIDDLLEKRINPNLKNRFGRTSLYYAVRKNDLKICNKLLKSGALTNLKDSKGDTILHLVVRNNYRALFAEMIENERDKWKQIDIDATNTIGMSAIFLAIEYNNFEMYIKLKNKGANLFLTDTRGFGLLHMCSAFGRKEMMIDLLHSDLDVNSRDLYGRPPLLTAIEFNKHEIFFYLIDRGIDVNVTDIDENTPLHIAFMYHHNCDVIKYLVQKMNLNAKNLIGQTPIHEATKWADEEIFSLIDRSKFDANIADNFGNTALHLALISRKKKIVKWILKENKLDENGVLKINCKGRNCIHYAAMYQNETFFQSLKNCVAADQSQKVILEERINDKDYPQPGNSGWKSPLQYARERNFERERDIINPLIELGAKERAFNSSSRQDIFQLDGKTSLHKAAESGSLEDVKKLLIENADPNIPDIHGRRPIHDAVDDVEKLEILKELCRFKANVNLRDQGGVSALLLSLKRKNIAAYEILKENDVDLSVRDKCGNTALHIALQYDANFAVIDLLKHNKRDLYCKNNAGKMAIEWVVENKNFELYKNQISENFHDKNLLINSRYYVQKKHSHHTARYILSKLLLVAIKCKADKFFWNLVKCQEARFDFEDENGNSPLQAAIESKNYACHEFMLPRVTITFENNMQENLLHIAVKSGAREFVKDLLEKKSINIDAMNVRGKSSLHMAIENISKKANPDFSSAQNYDSDVNSNAWNSSSMCDMLLKNGADINSRDIYKNTPLHLAIEKDSFLIVRDLLLNKDNVDVNAVNCEGKTPIFLAVEKQNFELYKTLKDKGAKLDVIDKFGFTLLHAAVSINFSDPIEDLIENKPFIVNQKDFKGRSPILLAIEMGYVGMYEKLKQLGANVKETDCGRNSALHLALTHSRLEIFRDLVDLGLDMDAKNLIGKTPIHCIVKPQADGDRYFQYAAETKFDPNLMDNYGNTPLHLAINKRNKKAIEWLIKSKSDLYLTNCRGRNAIHFAAQHRVAEFFDYVQELDERINDEDFIGKTPLQFARESNSKIIEEKLISLGAIDANK